MWTHPFKTSKPPANPKPLKAIPFEAPCLPKADAILSYCLKPSLFSVCTHPFKTSKPPSSQPKATQQSHPFRSPLPTKSRRNSQQLFGTVPFFSLNPSIQNIEASCQPKPPKKAIPFETPCLPKADSTLSYCCLPLPGYNNVLFEGQAIFTLIGKIGKMNTKSRHVFSQLEQFAESRPLWSLSLAWSPPFPVVMVSCSPFEVSHLPRAVPFEVLPLLEVLPFLLLWISFAFEVSHLPRAVPS